MYERTVLQFLQDILESVNAALEIVWDIVQHKLPELKVQFEKILLQETNSEKVVK